MYIGNIKCYGIVYKIENIINNKVYIGVTREERGFKGRYNRKGKGIERVYNYHLSCKKNYEYYNENLLNDIEYYGFDSFEVTEIFDVAFSMEELRIKEKNWVTIYDSYNNGYNNDEGGKYTDISGTNMPIICLNTMDIFYNVRNASIEMDIYYTNLLKAIRNKKCVKGYIFMKYEDFLILSPTEQLQISFLPIQLRDLRVVCLNDGTIYENAKYLRDTFGYFESGISACCRNESKSAYKNANDEPLVWRYYEDYEKMTQEEIEEVLVKAYDINYGNREGKKVINLTTMKVFDTIKEGAEFYGIRSKNDISKCCKSVNGEYERYSCGKLEDGTPLVWVYYEDFLKMTQEEINKRLNYNKGTKVVLLNTLEIFDTIKEGANKYNLDPTSLSECCNGDRKSCGKLNKKCMIWVKYEDYLNMTQEEINKRLDYNYTLENNNGKKVICLDTLEVFESRASACRKYNIDSKSLRECCNGDRKSAKGLHWMNYVDYLELQIG